MLGGHHDDGLSVAGGKIRVHGGIDDEEVVGAVDLGVEIDDSATVGLATVVDAHLGAAHPVIAADHLGSQDVIDGGTGGDVREGRVATAGEVKPILHKVSHGLAILLVDQPGLGVENRVSTSGNTKLANSGCTVGQECADSDDAVGHGTSGALKVSNATISALCRCPEVHALSSLGDRTRALVVKLQVRLDGLSSDVVELVGGEVALGLELKHDLGVVLEMMSNGEVDEVRSSGKSDTSLGSTLFHDSESIRLADASVPEKTRSRHGTSCEDDLTARLDIDDLLASVGALGKNASDLAAGSNGLDNLCLELESKVGKVLGEGHISASRSSTHVVLDRPRRARVHKVFLVRLLDRVNLLPALGAQVSREDSVGSIIVVLSIIGGRSSTRVALIQAISGLGEVSPAPALGPALEIALRRVDEVEAVDGAGSAEETASGRSCVTAELGARHAGHAAAESGDVVGSEGVVPWEGLSSVAESNGVGWAALDEKNTGARLGEALSGDDTSGTTADDDDIVGHVGGGGGQSGGVSRDAGCACSRSGGSLLGHSSPGGELGRSSFLDIKTELSKASAMIVQSALGIRRGIDIDR